jgi:hypothetical protein
MDARSRNGEAAASAATPNGTPITPPTRYGLARDQSNLSNRDEADDLSRHGSQRDQRRDHRRREGMEPDARCDKSSAETGEAGGEAGQQGTDDYDNKRWDIERRARHRS